MDNFTVDRLTLYKSQTRWLIVGRDHQQRHRMLQVSRDKDNPTLTEMGRYFTSDEVESTVNMAQSR